jgi:hypothetical protein
MSAFKSIALHVAQGQIAKLYHESKRTCKPVSFDSAKSVLLLFDGREANTRAQAEAWAATQTGKQIHLFYLQEHDGSGATPNGYHKKETNWADLPKQEVVNRCSSLQADLCILFNPLDVPSLHFLAMAHPAGMKVSTVSKFPSHADLVFDIKQKALTVFLAEVAHFMENILV